LREFAFGNDERPLELGEEVKSISSEETFERDTLDRMQLRLCLWQQAQEIGAKLKRKRLVAQTVEETAIALDELEWHRWLMAEPRGYSFVARIVRRVVERDMVTEGQRRRVLMATG
jgi:nucleotidyltransferase/DNA polymerase involved in DNA repair